MSLAGFHPVVRRWFESRFGEPTPAQNRGWQAIRSGGDTLIAAPTGSGKTLAGFLTAIDALLGEGLESGALPDETRVVYVSPLKALGADIHRNLAEPRREIRRLAAELGLPDIRITAAVRSGDTPQRERAAMLRRPPHILVTTPESLYLLLTAKRSREMLRTARTVIVDEIHAVLESRRGAHLALTLERLAHVAQRPLQRIGLSATQRPIEKVGRFLVGAERADPTIVDEGHYRELDLTIELPGSPLEAVMSGEVWEEVYDRLATLIRQHRTTLVFVNTRRLAERAARHLADRLGQDAVATHHGSLSRETRADAEERLKAGALRALVATASLELGIDIGAVDLVCQIGSPRRASTLLQRVGRSGHTVGGTPMGRLFPLSRDELVECAALVHMVQAGELDRFVLPPGPLDVLAQQVVAEAAAEDWDEAALFQLARRAWPYRELQCASYDDVVSMLALGFATRRGRRGALLHRDAVHRRLRGRRGARMTAIVAGGAIPDNADYRVVLEPAGTFVGTVNEDFAVESMAGDVFQLGNASWRVLGIQQGVMRVADAQGEPPNIPFWLGEAPARSEELSAAVSWLRGEVASRLQRPSPGSGDGDQGREGATASAGTASAADDGMVERDHAVDWLQLELGLSRAAAEQIVAYLAETRRLLGVVPTQQTPVLERFFDEAGGMQLVLHAPFGSRVNRAWGLALRKKFCRTFNFELQAAATDEGVLLSLGPQHSFPLGDVFHYLKPATARDTLVQAVLDAPLFQTRWRWNASIALAVPRSRGGRRTPPPLQRMQAEDLLAAVFPDAAACLENITGDREVPDHPLVRQTLRDCLEEAMDLPRLEAVLGQIRAGTLVLVAKDTPEPSPMAAQLLNARPYAFLDDAPLEERRTQAVYVRRALEPSSAADLGALDAAAIQRVRDEAWPDAESADEMHDALLTGGFFTDAEISRGREGQDWPALLAALSADGRATRATPARARRVPAPGGVARSPAGGRPCLWVAAERLAELGAAAPELDLEPRIQPPAGHTQVPERSDAIRELLRARLEVVGPITAVDLGAPLGLVAGEAEAALLSLEAQGVVLRGHFTPGAGSTTEWCDRRLLARIHRYTLDRLRAEIQPVSAADFMRFLFRWQHAAPDRRVAGLEGLAEVVEQLDGFEAPAAAWEGDVLPTRVDGYEPELLDLLCLSGRAAWGRLSRQTRSGGAPAGPLRTSPIAFFSRSRTATWLRLADCAAAAETLPDVLSTPALQVLAELERGGASFFQEIVAATGLLPTQAERALGELVALGLVTADGFSGLRALLTPSNRRSPLGAAGRGRRPANLYSVDTAGRWAAIVPTNVEPSGGAENRGNGQPDSGSGRSAPGTREAQAGGQHGRDGLRRKLDQDAVEAMARALLRRWGVVFRRLLAREALGAPWRELALVYRRLEARGEIRGGRFVVGMAGEQFALPEAVGSLRAVRRTAADGGVVAVSGADPLNLVGVITPGDRVPAVATNHVAYRDGTPVAALEAGNLYSLDASVPDVDEDVRRALLRRPAPPSLRTYLRPRRSVRRGQQTDRGTAG
jgi:ATP-dependent helicase Lhr and Lhr-like helicase